MKKIFHSLQIATSNFYRHFPALYSGLYFLIGISTAFHLSFLIVGLLFFTIERKIFFLLIILIGFLYTKALHPFPDLKEEQIYGSGVFHFEKIKRFKTPFHTKIACDGILLVFQTKTNIYHRLPCRLYFSMHENRPQENKNYFINDCLLINHHSKTFTLKTTKKTKWRIFKKSNSYAKWQFKMKEKVRAFAKKSFKNKQVISLVSTLLTGDRENRLMTYHFNRLGLTHLLTISGFHFALLTFLLSFLLRLFLSRKQTGLILVFLLSLYFTYMGAAPSINRAFSGVILLLLAPLFYRTYNALNALGISLIAALMANPPVVKDIGFQLSFSATFAILLFYSPFEKGLQKIFKKRLFSCVQTFSLKDQLGAILSHYLRKVLALNGAIIIFTFPIFIFHFHNFPLMSLFYNLFYPFLFSIMLFFLLISLVLPFLCPIVEFYLTFLLDIVLYAPKKLLFSLHCPKVPLEVIFFYFFGLFFLGVYLKWSHSTIKQWEEGI